MKVVSWNIEGRLTRFAENGRRGSPEHIIKGIRRLDGDIVFLAEASDGDAIEPKITDALERMGYEIHTVPYEGTVERKWAAEEAPNMKFLTRLKLQNFEKIRLGDIRNALVADIIEPETGQELRLFGVHLDDRSESYRLKQIEDLLVHVNESSMSTIVMGDYNAMNRDDVRARFLRSWAVSGTIKLWPFPRSRSVFVRLADMATGDTLAALEKGSELRDADPRRRATTTPKMRFQEWLPSIPLVQIDHFYISPEVSAVNYKVSDDGGSDHRAISATIRLQGV